MTVELSPVEELDIDESVLDFAIEHYCGNCTHFEFRETEDEPEADSVSFCTHWEEPTRVEPDMICESYLPQGYE